MIRGLARLRAQHGIAARLLIVGGESDDAGPEITPEIGRLQEIASAEGLDRGGDVRRHAAAASSSGTTTAPPTSSSRRPGTSRSASRRSRRWPAARRSSARTSAASSTRCATARPATSCRPTTPKRWRNGWRTSISHPKLLSRAQPPGDPPGQRPVHLAAGHRRRGRSVRGSALRQPARSLRSGPAAPGRLEVNVLHNLGVARGGGRQACRAASRRRFLIRPTRFEYPLREPDGSNAPWKH